MTKSYDRIKEGLEEALSIAKREQPAASITVHGHVYVPKAELDKALLRYDERNRTAQDRAVSNGLKLERITELETELDDLKHDIQTYIAANSDLLAENERLVRNAQTEAWLLAGYHRICERHGIAPSSAELIAAAKEVESEGRV